MWPDPADLSKRKPRFLKGTPAIKVSFYICSLITATYLGGLVLIQYTPFFQNKVKRYQDSLEQVERDRNLRQFIQDPMVERALRKKRVEYENKEDILI